MSDAVQIIAAHAFFGMGECCSCDMALSGPRMSREEWAAHVLAVLSETHAVVELPEPDIDDEGYHWFREGSNATEIHAYPGGGVGYQRVWEWTPDQMRDVAACWAAAARVAEVTR